MKYQVRLNGETVTLNAGPDGIQVNDVTVQAELIHASSAHEAVLRIGSKVYRLAFTRVNGARKGKSEFILWVNGERFSAEVLDERAVSIEKFATVLHRPEGAQKITAPMPGLILRVNVAVGDSVAAGQGVIVMEAMKMENELRAAIPGVVRSVHVRPGLAVEKGTLLLETGPAEG